MKGMLVSGIMDNLNSTFDSVNAQVGQIASDVGMTPASYAPGEKQMRMSLLMKMKTK